jgi:glucose dehydrogenase
MALTKRPFGVWLILAFYVVATCFLSVELLSLVSYFPNRGLFVLGAIAGGAVNIIAAVLLFRMRRSAVVLFGISFVFSTVMTIRGLVGSNWKTMDAGSPAAITVGWLIALAIFLYALRLRQRGILR